METPAPATPTGEPTAPAGVNATTGEVEDRDALDAAQATPRRRTFNEFLAEHNRGALLGELTEGLAEVVAGVVEHRKKGELVIKLTVKPEGSASVTVVGDVTVKAPEADPEPAFYYVAEDGTANLLRNPIGQRTFGDLAEVPRPEAVDVTRIER